MKMRHCFAGLAALAAVATLPNSASAQNATGCNTGYVFFLGLGGSLNGCFTGTLTQLGEDAGLVSEQYYWGGNFGSTMNPTNDPTVAGTDMFDDQCGSTGNGVFAFCTGANAKPPVSISNPSGELVLGLNVPDPKFGTSYYWVYSGASGRNAVPAPPGFQAVLLQLTLNGADDPGQFLFGWEDLNSGCTARTATNNNRFREEDLGDGSLLNSVLGNCTALTPGGNSDNDYNDSYMQFSIVGTGTPGDVTPEPATMTMLAFGLTAMTGAAMRRRKR